MQLWKQFNELTITNWLRLLTDSVIDADGTNVTAAEIATLSGLTATAAELNRAADLTGRVVSLTGTDAITAAEHEGRICYITGTAAAAYTLPEATGSGGVYTFVMGQVNTNGTTIVTPDTTNSDLVGSVNILDLDAAAQTAYGSLQATGNDTITLNGTTTGGQIGDMLVLRDVATDVWQVFGQLLCPTGSNPATPFSSS